MTPRSRCSSRRSNHRLFQRISRYGWPNTAYRTSGWPTRWPTWRPAARANPAGRAAVSCRRGCRGDGADRASRRCAALTGDCTTASRLADELLGSEDAAERAAAVRIAASIAVHDGSAAQAATCSGGSDRSRRVRQRLRRDRVGRRGRPARPGSAERKSADRRPRRPAPRAASPRVCCCPSISRFQSPWHGWASRSTPNSSRRASPGYARRTGDAGRSAWRRSGARRSVIGRAVAPAAKQTPPTRLRRPSAPAAAGLGADAGRAAARGSLRRSAVAAADAALHRRDALWAAALQTAIARRSGDSGAVQKYWYAAMEVLAEYSMDLFSLLPLGELWVAAARMRQVDRLQHTLAEAFALLESLGDPVLWSVPLHWAAYTPESWRIHPRTVAHGQALTARAAHSAFAKALAIAGRTWLRVLANHVDTDEVTGAARALSNSAGRGTRAAGESGGPADPDGRVSGAMLQLARDLKQTIATTRGQASRQRRGEAESGAPRRLRASRPRGCLIANARWPNCCCWACPIATSAVSCSSPRRPSSTTSPGFGGGLAPNRDRRCCRCCAPC